MAAASSSAPFFGIREEANCNNQPPRKQQSNSSTPNTSSTGSHPTAPPKKKRNLPGNPNPDAEVIALSPRTLLATNRFICEVCNKGFQREQNLQLHRRGHNLPWKLKKKNPKEVRRRRVYLCPEPACVHHDPSRALGDLTGIKKHYCRKHGEKKWKCDKCSKKYAVQSDWKSHAKVCGTREYRCDCGTLFSRRDSFITHRAFCDALAQESTRLPNAMNSISSHLYGNSSINLGLPQLNSQLSSFQSQALSAAADRLQLGGDGGAAQFDQLTASIFHPPQSSSPFFLGGSSSQEFKERPQVLQNKPCHGLIQEMQANTNASSSSSAATPGNPFNLNFFSNSTSTSAVNNNDNASSQSGHLLIPSQLNNTSGNSEPTRTMFAGNLMSNDITMNMSSLFTSSVHNESAVPQMSATALLQKAAQIGATSSGGGGSLLRGFGSTNSNLPAEPNGSGLGKSSRTRAENEINPFKNLMNSLANGRGGIFGGGNEQGGTGVSGFNPGLNNMDENKLQQNLSSWAGGGMGGSDRLTRDFLGVRGVMRSTGGGM